MAYAILHFHR
jgi:hypothetical protein